MVEASRSLRLEGAVGGIPCLLSLSLCQGRQMAAGERRAPPSPHPVSCSYHSLLPFFVPLRSILLQSFLIGTQGFSPSTLQIQLKAFLLVSAHLRLYVTPVVSSRNIAEYPSGKHNSQSLQASSLALPLMTVPGSHITDTLCNMLRSLDFILRPVVNILSSVNKGVTGADLCSGNSLSSYVIGKNKPDAILDLFF